MSSHHEIPATPETMVLGYFDAALPPVDRPVPAAPLRDRTVRRA